MPLAGPADEVAVGATRVVADESYTCARVEGGRVLCWGEGDQGRLGDGGGGARPTPGPVTGLTDVVELAAGSSHTCARRR